jgi:Hydantoinase/oxoprolinase
MRACGDVPCECAFTVCKYSEEKTRRHVEMCHVNAGLGFASILRKARGHVEMCHVKPPCAVAAQSQVRARTHALAREMKRLFHAWGERRYIATFQAGFDGGLGSVQLSFMQSDGGLTPVAGFSGHKAILSGPAGGYVGYALTTRWARQTDQAKLQVIGFDMGGTSTDVSRFAGSYEHVFESSTAGRLVTSCFDYW